MNGLRPWCRWAQMPIGSPPNWPRHREYLLWLAQKEGPRGLFTLEVGVLDVIASDHQPVRCSEAADDEKPFLISSGAIGPRETFFEIPAGD